MISGLLFTLVRIFELITLTALWGILAWFVDAYQPAIPPDRILYPFVVAILATVWALGTLLMYRQMRWMPLYIAIIDLCFFGILIGGVVVRAPTVKHTNCVNWSDIYNRDYGSYHAGSVTADRQCLMLKSSWGLGIVNIVLFFFSAVLAWHVWQHTGVVVYEERPRRRRRSGRRSRW